MKTVEFLPSLTAEHADALTAIHQSKLNFNHCNWKLISCFIKVEVISKNITVTEDPVDTFKFYNVLPEALLHLPSYFYNIKTACFLKYGI